MQRTKTFLALLIIGFSITSTAFALSIVDSSVYQESDIVLDFDDDVYLNCLDCKDKSLYFQPGYSAVVDCQGGPESCQNLKIYVEDFLPEIRILGCSGPDSCDSITIFQVGMIDGLRNLSIETAGPLRNLIMNGAPVALDCSKTVTGCTDITFLDFAFPSSLFVPKLDCQGGDCSGMIIKAPPGLVEWPDNSFVSYNYFPDPFEIHCAYDYCQSMQIYQDDVPEEIRKEVFQNAPSQSWGAPAPAILFCDDANPGSCTGTKMYCGSKPYIEDAISYNSTLSKWEWQGTCAISPTECSQYQFESIPYTTYSNRVCTDLTVCSAYEVEILPPTSTSDRFCAAAPCGDGTIVINGECAPDPDLVITCATGTTLNATNNECEPDVTQADLDQMQGALNACTADLATANTDLAACSDEVSYLEGLLTGKGETVVCHKPGTKKEATLPVTAKELQDHLKHGDTLGACGS